MFTVQKLTASRIWTTLMSSIQDEQSAIRYANVQSGIISERIRVISSNGSVVYLAG